MNYMIVNDNSLVVDLLSKIIKNNGSRVIKSNNGAMAISSMYKFKPDIIVLDIDILDIDVRTLISVFLEVKASCYIILNGFHNGYDKKILQSCYLAGAKDILLKSFNIQQLTNSLTKAEENICSYYKMFI